MQPRSATGLAAFRVMYSLTLLCEVLQLFYFRHLVFDATPYLSVGGFSLGPVFGVWVLSILCLALGLFTRQATIVNFVMTLLTFSITSYWEYHIDYIYTGVGFFLLFLPVEQTLSIDAWWARRRAVKDRTAPPLVTVPRVHYDALILVGIAVVYLDSVFYKLASPMWTSGLGMWRPASLPHNTFWDIGWLLDLKLLMVTLGYLTLVFEVSFIVTMWFDRVRPLLLVIGVGLHLGIVLTFPIPWFGLAVSALYMLLVPDEWWRWVASKVPSATISSRAPVASNAPSKVISEPVSQIARSDRTMAVVVAAFAIIVTLAQMLQTSRAPLSRRIAVSTGLEPVRQTFADLALRTDRFSRVLFGVTPHPVFMDFHFDGYEAFYTLVHVAGNGRQTWLPMSNERGHARLGWSGRLWVHWTWRVSNPQPNPREMGKGMRHVTAWWLGHTRRGFQEQQFVVMRRECDPCDGWREGYYQEQLDHEWRPVGAVQWTNGECEVTLDPAAFAPTGQGQSVARETEK